MPNGKQIPQAPIKLATLYSISGAATGVYVVTCVAERFGMSVDSVAVILALLTAASIYALKPAPVSRYNPLHVILIAMNGGLIFIHATGFNTVTHAVPTGKASKPAKASLFPDFDKVPWFPPADQRIAAQDMARSAKETLATVDSVLKLLDDLAAPPRHERLVFENRLREERPKLEQQLKQERDNLDKVLSNEYLELMRQLKARETDRQRLEDSLRKGVHPNEREAIEGLLADAQQAEKRLKARLTIVAWEEHRKKMQEELEAKQRSKLMEHAAKEKDWKDQVERLGEKEKRLKELQTEAAPTLGTVKQELVSSEKRITMALQELDRSYAGVRGYSPTLPPKNGKGDMQD